MSKPNDKPNKALGKGLAALLPNRPAHTPKPAQPHAQPTTPPPDDAPKPTHGMVTLLRVDLIDPSAVQPRSVFDPAKLQELVDSVRANGIIQPILVRPNGDRYQLIAGERRLRAVKIVGHNFIPAIIQEHFDNQLLEVALIENIQREDLNPIEIAHAFDQLHRHHGFNHDEIARRTGKDRATVTNTLRLLKLPSEVQLLLAERRISMGHARALLAIDDEQQLVNLAHKSASQGQSVRQLERIVRDLTSKTTADELQAPKTEKPQDPNVKAAATAMQEVLGTRVRIVEKNDQRGRIEIEYYSQEDLDRVYNLIVGEK
jgi:ParB family chromosome partitioning protein